MTRRAHELGETLQPGLPQSVADMLAPETVLPEQFFSGPRRDSESSPERALMLAVLEDGIRCFQQFMSAHGVRRRMLSRQAERWIRASDGEWPFSFDNVCESLGIDPVCLRKALLRMKYECLTGKKPQARKAKSRGHKPHLAAAGSPGKSAASQTDSQSESRPDGYKHRAKARAQ